MKPTILGYDRLGNPIHQAPEGSIVTHAFIICSTCRKAISTVGGPRHGSDCLDCYPIRQAFERDCYPNFSPDSAHGLRRKESGEYISDTLEDHWQTFQEGWESAIEHLKNRTSENFSDIVSDGGMDPRSRHEN